MQWKQGGRRITIKGVFKGRNMVSDTIYAIQEDIDRPPLRGSHLFDAANPGFRYASAWATLVLALRAALGIRDERMIHSSVRFPKNKRQLAGATKTFYTVPQ
jgi:hypothetical protein